MYFILSLFCPMEIQIPRNHEYRIELLETQKIKLMVISGLAEVFGQELLNEKWYNFTNIKISIFTFTGAIVKIEGNCDLHYLAENTCFPKIFSYFDNVKETSKVIAVLGKGRSVFSSTLSNYFIRIHRKIDFIEIDPSKGNIFPAALSYMQVNTLIDCSDGMKLNNPFSLFFGSLSIENIELYDIQISKLSEEVKDRKTGDFKIILCPNTTNDILEKIVRVFDVNEIVCIGDERLFNKLNLQIPKIFITNTGFINENTVSKSINRYFNGPNNEYTPSSFLLKSEYTVVRMGEQHAAPESALPLGATRKIGHTDICKCEMIQNSVLAISEAENEDQITTSPVLGFVVYIEDKKSRILCAQPKLPKCKYLIQGSLKFVEF